MKTYTCKNIRNIALAGHGGSGKTSVCEGLLYKCGEIERMGKVSDGNSVMDYDPEEIKRKISLGTSLAYCQWKDVKINILDTPGQFDFAAGLYEGISAAESVGRYDKGLQRGGKAGQGYNVRSYPYGRREQQLLQVP